MRGEDSQIILVFVSAAAVVLLMAALVTFFIVVYQKRLLKKDQHLQKLETDYQKGLLQATIEGQERERKRLAKDLHDGIGSLLTGLNLNLKHQLSLETEDASQHSFLQEACNMLQDGIGEVRRVSHNLMPAALENFGLVQALQEWIEQVQTDNFSTSLQLKGKAFKLPQEVDLGLFRVSQELLQNTLRHSHASKSHFELIYEPEEMRLVYSDNGQGFDPSLHSSGIGIKNMQSRIASLNGNIELTSLNAGFKASVSIPLSTSYEQ